MNTNQNKDDNPNKKDENKDYSMKVEEKHSSDVKEDKPKKITITNFMSQASHPKICLFTILFKILSIFTYVILAFFTERKGLVYLIVILFGCVDFWITKNISGRILVGLRWWNEVKKDGKEIWIFESKNEKNEATADKSVFWTSLYINTIAWAVLFIFKLITLSVSKTVIALVMLILAGLNLYGYFKCSNNQKDKLKKLTGKFAAQAVKKGIEQGAKQFTA